MRNTPGWKTWHTQNHPFADLESDPEALAIAIALHTPPADRLETLGLRYATVICPRCELPQTSHGVEPERWYANPCDHCTYTATRLQLLWLTARHRYRYHTDTTYRTRYLTYGAPAATRRFYWRVRWRRRLVRTSPRR